MTKTQHALFALLTAGLLAGCSSTKLDTAAPVETRSPTAGAGAGSGNDGAGVGAQSRVTPVDLSANQNANAQPRVIYFDFDSFVVKDEFKPVVESNAKALAADRTRKLSVQGHTDERGGSEYNLALGQKRAEAVVKSLTLLGASDNQLEAVSFGKERPAAQGHDEESWAKNRRVELVNR